MGIATDLTRAHNRLRIGVCRIVGVHAVDVMCRDLGATPDQDAQPMTSGLGGKTVGGRPAGRPKQSPANSPSYRYNGAAVYGSQDWLAVGNGRGASGAKRAE